MTVGLGTKKTRLEKADEEGGDEGEDPMTINELTFEDDDLASRHVLIVKNVVSRKPAEVPKGID